jgi:hypothetical protein
VISVTPRLQPGVLRQRQRKNRFNGFYVRRALQHRAEVRC